MHDDTKKNEEIEEEIKPIVEEVNWESPDYAFIPKGNHIWRQEGYFLICSSCDLSHAVCIGKDKILVGEKDGKPIIKTRRELGMA